MRQTLKLIPFCLALLTGACAKPAPGTSTSSVDTTNTHSASQQAAANSCGAVTALGDCNANVIEACDMASDTIVTTDCAASGLVCRLVSNTATCVDSSATDTGSTGCGTVPQAGVCSGNIMRWCQGGNLFETDCSYDHGVVCVEANGTANCVAG